jgi:chromosome partitioning protein
MADPLPPYALPAGFRVGPGGGKHSAPAPSAASFGPSERAIKAAADVSRETSAARSAATPDEDTPLARAAAAAVMAASGRIGDPLPRPPHPRILTVANQKGGVGKTTTTVNLAAALALQGLHVLVVDLDPQGNASTALGVPHHSEVPSVYEVLVDDMPLATTVRPVERIIGLDAVPATLDLAGAEIELVSLVAREGRLRRALEAFLTQSTDRYDYILIDCPPSLGLLTVNALVAADEVLIPIQCEYYALEGLGQLIRNVDMVRAHLNPGLHISSILLTMYDGRTKLAAQVAEEVRDHFGDRVLPTAIPRSVRVSEAPSFQQTVITYDPGSTGAQCYLQAARELAHQPVVPLDSVDRRARGAEPTSDAVIVEPVPAVAPVPSVELAPPVESFVDPNSFGVIVGQAPSFEAVPTTDDQPSSRVVGTVQVPGEEGTS